MEMVREYVQIKFEGLVYLKRELKVRLISKRSFISDAEVKYLKIYVLITQKLKKIDTVAEYMWVYI